MSSFESGRRRCLVAGALAAVAGVAPRAMAADAVASYPVKTVRVISPFSPGGNLDAVLRPLLQRVGDILHQTFYLDNRAGANGTIGINVGTKSDADGYTLIGVTSGAVTINPSVYARLPYDTLKDLAPITDIGNAPFVLVVNPSLNVHNVGELVQLVKSKPGQLPYGSPGIGGTNHLGAEAFLQATGLKMIHVPYKGSQPLMTDLIGGQVVMAFDSVTATVPLIKAGKLRAIGIAAAQRSPVAPDIPTIAEAGGPRFELSSWYGIMAPGATPKGIVTKLNAAFVKALAAPDLRALYASLGVVVVGNSPEQFAQEIHNDMDHWSKIAKAANVHAD